MSNTIRTPKEGITEGSRRIAQAVDDEAWQRFRVSMKGQSTLKKLNMLRRYYYSHDGGASSFGMTLSEKIEQANVRIRVDNYLKALCRGGQLHPGVTLETFINLQNFDKVIKSG